MKNISLLLISFGYVLSLSSQIEQISVGPQYQMQTYYSITEGTVSSNSSDLWDIAFTVQGIREAGIFINEAAPLGATSQIELYTLGVSDFEEIIDIDTAPLERLYNSELDWQFGAFNNIRDEEQVFDYGWGEYDGTLHTVFGNNVYLIKLRNGEWKKIFIESLFVDWVFRYADLDGSNLVEKVISKIDYEGQALVHYSMENDEVVDIEPAEWDLLFTRYNTYTHDGMGNYLNYVVTGVLSGLGVTVAEVDGVDPETIESEDIGSERYATELDVIGFDWKEVDINSSLFSIVDDRSYFVKNAGEHVCKIQFIDFEGALTGVVTIDKECYQVAAIGDISIDGIKSLDVFPNPTTDVINILVDFETAADAEILLVDMSGRVMQKNQVEFTGGVQNRRIDIDVANGVYTLLMRVEDKVQAVQMIVQK
jgi:hypothetical protein